MMIYLRTYRPNGLKDKTGGHDNFEHRGCKSQLNLTITKNLRKDGKYENTTLVIDCNNNEDWNEVIIDEEELLDNLFEDDRESVWPIHLEFNASVEFSKLEF